MTDKKTSAALSIPMSETVRGYEIKRLPLGRYMQALEALRSAPEAIIQACFPGMDAAQILARLKALDKDALIALMMRAMAVVPGEAVKLLSLLTGVPQAALLEDAAIGLDGAAEMLEAFWRLNGIENFTQAAVRMAAQLKDARKRIGFSG